MHKGFDSSALKIAVGLILFTGLAIGSYHLIGAQRASAQTQKNAASPSGFDAVVRNNSERYRDPLYNRGVLDRSRRGRAASCSSRSSDIS